MTKRELLQALLDGKKLQDEWSVFYLNNNDQIIAETGMGVGKISLDEIHFGSTRLYQEPKKLVKKTMWQPVYRKRGMIFDDLATCLFDSYESAINSVNSFIEVLEYVGAVRVEVECEE